MFIKALMSRFGDAGYAFYFQTLELIADQGTADGSVAIEWEVYQRMLHKSRATVLQLLVFCATNGKLSYDDKGTMVIITCPKFAEYADNFTKSVLRTTQSLRSDDTATSPRLDKTRLDKNKERRFIKPTVKEIQVYMVSIGLLNAMSQAEMFFDFYESKEWKVGKSPMKNWQAAVRNWKRRSEERVNNSQRQEPRRPIYRQL